MTNVNLNIPPRLIEAAREAQYENRDRLNTRQNEDKIKEKIQIQARKEKKRKDPLSEERLGGQLEFGKKDQYKIWTKKRILIGPAFLFSEITIEAKQQFTFTYPSLPIAVDASADNTLLLPVAITERYYLSDEIDRTGKEAQLFNSYPLLSNDSINIFMVPQINYQVNYVKTQPVTLKLDLTKTEKKPEDNAWTVSYSSENSSLLFYELTLNYTRNAATIARTQNDNLLPSSYSPTFDGGWTVIDPLGIDNVSVNANADVSKKVYSATCFFGNDSRGKYARIFTGGFFVRLYGGELIEQTDLYKTYLIKENMITIYAIDLPVIGENPISLARNTPSGPVTTTTQVGSFVISQIFDSRNLPSNIFTYPSLKVDLYQGEGSITTTRSYSNFGSKSTQTTLDSGEVSTTVDYFWEQTLKTVVEDYSIVDASYRGSQYSNINQISGKYSREGQNTNPQQGYSWTETQTYDVNFPLPLTSTITSPQQTVLKIVRMVFGSSIETLPENFEKS